MSSIHKIIPEYLYLVVIRKKDYFDTLPQGVIKCKIIECKDGVVPWIKVFIEETEKNKSRYLNIGGEQIEKNCYLTEEEATKVFNTRFKLSQNAKQRTKKSKKVGQISISGV